MGVTVTRRADGLTIATDTMPGVETVSLGAWVRAGTRHEKAAHNGIAHLLEHMAFKGTGKRSAYEIAEEIEAVGGYLNAATSRESTAFYAKVLKDDVPLAVDLIGDILQNPLFEAEELERERMVVLQEIGQAQDTPDDIIFDHFQEVAYPDQAIGRPILGRTAIVETLGRDELVGYLGEHYGPDRMVIAAAGNVDHEVFLGLVEEAFDGLKPGEGESLEPAAYKGGQFRESRDLEQIHLLLGFGSVSLHDPDFYAATLLSTLLGGGMSSRLFQEVREKRGLAYSIYSFNSAFLDNGLFGIYAGTGPGEAAGLLDLLWQELQALPGSVSEEELARAKTQLRASLMMSRESTSARCDQLAQHLLVYGRVIEPAEIVGLIAQVDRAAIDRAAGRLLASPATLAVSGPLAAVTGFEAAAARLQAQ